MIIKPTTIWLLPNSRVFHNGTDVLTTRFTAAYRDARGKFHSVPCVIFGAHAEIHADRKYVLEGHLVASKYKGVYSNDLVVDKITATGEAVSGAVLEGVATKKAEASS